MTGLTHMAMNGIARVAIARHDEAASPPEQSAVRLAQWHSTCSTSNMRVSIVIDNYNYESYVAQTIESALAQTHPDVEVVVVDDGSRDRSMEVIRRYADRVIVIDKPNGGQGSAYNAGYARATGDLIIFLDADDWLYPEAAAEIVALWRTGVSKVQFRLDMVDKIGASLGRQVPRVMHDKTALELVISFGAYGSPPGSGNAFHRSYLNQVLPMDERAWRIGADSVPILLAPVYGAVMSAPRALGAYRLHRPLNDGALFFGNSSSALVDEQERVLACKRMVELGLKRAGLPHSSPLGLAPWEARTLALCLRFRVPGTAVAPLAGGSEPDLKYALSSLWRWPSLSPWRRLSLLAWVLAVQFLPMSLARRVAQLHRRFVGLPTD